ncbi:hypothetical protein [Polyangium sp. 15x6]|uniref:hypothetical protein n=1 Tax=Polyangium sp. 15x6 TaxID=3042687 RepID=UPI00249C3D07|nr:hypothetical protein [Polyangium sp. 15x6]MDI3284147.1 hypothetical protein [Polyangium sp. 15x6]
MKMPERSSGNGVRVAKALLGLVDEYSAEDFEAAEKILGQEELVHALRMLAKFKGQHRDAPANEVKAPSETQPPPEEGASSSPEEYLSEKEFREIVKRELVKLPVDVTMARRIASHLTGMRFSPNRNAADVLCRSIELIEKRFPEPWLRIEKFGSLLRSAAAAAGPDHAARIELLLRDTAIKALSTNTIIFPKPFDLAKLRELWAPSPLPFAPDESREHLVSRLFEDAVRLAPNTLPDITFELLKRGLRSPTDLAVTGIRRTNAKKGHDDYE